MSKLIQLIYKILLRFMQDNSWKYYQELRKKQKDSKKKIQKRQFERLKILLKHAYNNINMYHEIWSKAKVRPENIRNLKDIRKLPIVSKQDFRKYFPNRCITKNINKKKLIKNSTSGSTGKPFEFFIDKHMDEMKKARVQLGYEWASLYFGEPLCVLWGEHPETLKGKIFRKFFQHTLFLSAFDINSKNYVDYIEKIKKHKTKTIQTYASAIVHLAKLLKENNINIKIKTLKSIISSGEPLTKNNRKLVEEIFGCKVFDRYGTREYGCIAHECEKHNMHIMEESFVIEFIKNNKQVKENQEGDIIVTCLDNFAMPLVRYKIDDYGKFTTKKCSCGRKWSIIKEVTARLTDFVKIPNGEIISFLYFNYFFEQWGAYVRQFRVIQEKTNFINVFIVPTKKFKNEMEEKIKKGLQKKLKNVRLNLKIVKKIPLTKAGKNPCVISKLNE